MIKMQTNFIVFRGDRINTIFFDLDDMINYIYKAYKGNNIKNNKEEIRNKE